MARSCASENISGIEKSFKLEAEAEMNISHSTVRFCLSANIGIFGSEATENN